MAGKTSRDQSGVTLRAATVDDAEAVADAMLASRRAFLPYAPPAHSEPDFRRWVREVLLVSSDVSVAVSDGDVIGVLATSRSDRESWIDQFYLRPDAVGQGIGTRMLRKALGRLPEPVRLWTFQQNSGSRRFYERHGFEPVRITDGRDNEERCPDVLYERRRLGRGSDGADARAGPSAKAATHILESGELTMPTYLVVGASRGIGGASAAHLAARGADILSVSRGQPSVGSWIEADIGSVEGVRKVVDSVAERRLDALLFLGGVWEKGAFTEKYRFLDSPADETLQVLAVNLAAPILLAQGLAENLARSRNARIVLMGSTSGLPNTATKEVANTAAKFGLQGVAESLNLSLRGHGIATTVINPDNVATSEVESDIADGLFGDQVPIPMEDMMRTIDYVLGVGPHSVPSSINLRQTTPEN